MTPLERAARALCLADGLDPDRKFKSSDWSEGTAPREFAWHEYLPKARAVLQAIREPSDDQLIEAQRAMFGSTHSAPLLSALTIGFQAMIDAALSE
jgi:hypothetical protein